ncbi:hypothetical protein Dsin_027373 [Dipteronia sinensis]|uniref:Chalcone synthase n=1 Tax=Dipteronia sinensis TaxID=43782 RepID=A0AAE0DUI4_9ROSI|nr:hypothetical protein Dsin_027373 [Dipteronia sinensis]
MVSVEEFRRSQRADGPATIMAIGKANPPNCVDQSTYPDYYFRVTNSEKTIIKKRYMFLTEEFLKENPNLATYDTPSLDVRQEILMVEIHKLGKEAALKAIKERGQAKSKITHLPGLKPRLHFANHVDGILVEAFKPLGISDWNSVFLKAHPGRPVIMDQVEATLGLNPEKLRASRHVLAEYGNMQSACVLFILDEMRKKSAKDGLETTGEWLEWGVFFGFGPGHTIETVVLHSFAAN